ncbi:MAG: peptide ABC transporter ATP-binding protein [Waddliaceae bacterium]|nr:peptide ABC transporter ATP-binding protein [Waddliaceae bacterium]
MKNPLLEIKNLSLRFQVNSGFIHALRGVNLQIEEEETLALVGESGCGKSVTAQSILQLLPSPPTQYESGEILFKGEDLLKKSAKEILAYRGSSIAMIFQDPMTSLNPTMCIGKQITESLEQHQSLSYRDARKEAIKLLDLVGISTPDLRFSQFPHEFSGGMRQRVMIAIALACKPKLLIADEPTTALDVTVQAQILALMKSLQDQFSMSILFITHDLGIVANTCDRVAVMYAGKVVEQSNVKQIFSRPQHPYTKALINSIPHLDTDIRQRLPTIRGTPPDLFSPPKGCAFAPRCKHSMRICHQIPPETFTVDSQESACWLHHPQALPSKKDLCPS